MTDDVASVEDERSPSREREQHNRDDVTTGTDEDDEDDEELSRMLMVKTLRGTDSRENR
jgi:hypothetical protein